MQNIKQEERPKCGAKRKLTDYESFAGVLKSTPKRKKSSKESLVEQTYGSPNGGIISTRDRTKPGMKAMAKGKVEHMREGDVILKKSDVSSKKQNMAVFSQVSFMHFFPRQKFFCFSRRIKKLYSFALFLLPCNVHFVQKFILCFLFR